MGPPSCAERWRSGNLKSGDRRGLWLGACVALALTALAAVRVCGGADRTQTEATALAELLGTRPEHVRLCPMRALGFLSDLGFARYRVEVRDAAGKVSETGIATIRHGQRAISVVLTSRLQKAQRIPYSEKRQQELAGKARAILRKAGVGTLCAATPRVTYMDGRIYAYIWGDSEDRAPVQSGARAAVGLAAGSGDLVSCQFWLPVEPTAIDEVRVTETQARRTVCRAYPKLASLLPEKATLVLNAPASPSGGPVWLYRTIEASGDKSAVIVDATTGKILTPGP